MPQCQGKRGYRTIAEAGGFARTHRKRGAPPLNIYYCDECGLFHLTSMTTAQQAEMLKQRKKKP